jgi:hypothetical protein
VTIQLPEAGLLTMRVAMEFGSAAAFTDSLEQAIADDATHGATVVALLDRGDLAIHVPHRGGPAWNVVPLLHLRPGEQPSDEDWAQANVILERLERYR